MLVFNEIKLYRENQLDCEFAMIKDNYQARVYSPFGGDRDGNPDTAWTKQSRFYNGVDDQGNNSITMTVPKLDGSGTEQKTYGFDDVTAAPDMYEIDYNEDPFHILGQYKEQMMPDGTSMVPRCLKTNVGDIFTTNMIADASVAVKQLLVPDANNKGILTVKA